MKDSAKKRVGILRGGTGGYYFSSLSRGGDIISHILENLSDKYKVFDILIDKQGVWHINGLPIIPADLMHKVDLVWNVAHPNVSVTLESLAIPNISTSSFSNALENSKQMLKKHMKDIGINIPRHLILPVFQKDFDGPREKYAIKKAKEVHEKFSGPWIVKSLTNDSDMGVHFAKTFGELVGAIDDGVAHQTGILIEEFIPGKVSSVHCLPNFRGQEFYVFSPVNVFGNLSSVEKEKLIALVKDLHNHVGIKHYLKSNFVLNKRGKAYLLDFESMPNLKPFSNFAQACEKVGAKMHHVVEHMLEGAL